MLSSRRTLPSSPSHDRGVSRCRRRRGWIPISRRPVGSWGWRVFRATVCITRRNNVRGPMDGSESAMSRRNSRRSRRQKIGMMNSIEPTTDLGREDRKNPSYPLGDGSGQRAVVGRLGSSSLGKKRNERVDRCSVGQRESPDLRRSSSFLFSSKTSEEREEWKAETPSTPSSHTLSRHPQENFLSPVLRLKYTHARRVMLRHRNRKESTKQKRRRENE